MYFQSTRAVGEVAKPSSVAILAACNTQTHQGALHPLQKLWIFLQRLCHAC